MSKLFSIDLDLGRCVCCYACVVACLDQHCRNVDQPVPALRRALRLEDAQGRIQCLSVGCMHCADAPCLAACPTGAIYRDQDTGLVLVDQTQCVGCRMCSRVCPFGAPQFGPDRKMAKCDGCVHRVRRGLPPICVQTCPSGALRLCQKETPPSYFTIRDLLAQNTTT